MCDKNVQDGPKKQRAYLGAVAFLKHTIHLANKCTTLDPTGACYSSFDAELPVAQFILTLLASKMQPLRDKRAVSFCATLFVR
ncbi:hypothetical protein L596_021919 [Steinernema carpocapsae]|uniref:Uncharacterized protein n=1 Tax=Steinernema carpocapsae TaxID=34508 RepID=A0A4U5MK93_STECR|nr:hypothetical protein L596_021919 [Steinernema carpocapsae]